MALNGNHQIFYRTTTGAPSSDAVLHRAFLIPSSSTPAWSHPATHHHHHHCLTIVSASKKFSPSRTGKFDGKNRKSSVSTKEEGEEEKVLERGTEINISDAMGTAEAVDDDGFVMPELPGEKPDFWEGPQWDGLGFFVQYMWAFGILFALISSGIAVVMYNDGATDFKETPAYKESVQSRELLEGPEASNSDVFESNPTEEAPSLE